MSNAARVNKKAGSVERARRSAAGPFVVKFVTLAFLLTMTILGALVWHAWDLYRDFKVTETLHLRTAELSGVIAHLDEVLTMSARMSAATGDPKWEGRYESFEPKLAAAIEEAKSLWPEALIGEAMAQTDAANVKLVTMERKAFGLVRKGRLEAASALLYSPEYEKQKQIYSEGLDEATVLMRGHSKTELRRHGLAALTATVALAVISVLVALLWLVALRVLKRYVEERKRAELSLRLSEQCFRAIADYTYFWEVWVSPGGRVLWTNPAVERITGYNIDELKAMSDYPIPLIHEEDRGRIGRAFKSALRGGSGKEVQFRLQRKDGKVIWVDMSWQPIYDDKGFSQGHRASIREITQRKEAEEALRTGRTATRCSSAATACLPRTPG
ncbi:MAG: PAS domain-containing protein [Planctomycetota bacterium]|jgi:PAS domain S-box-containing protein